MTLATVLLLIAISQRFKTRGVRVALLVIALLLLCFPVYHILTLPGHSAACDRVHLGLGLPVSFS